MLIVTPVIILEWLPGKTVNPLQGSYGGIFRQLKRTRNKSAMLFTTLTKFENEIVTYIFDFSNFPEVISGETINTPTVTASSLTVGAVSIITTKTDGVPANQGVSAVISGGIAGETYDIYCQVDMSGGDVRIVKGRIYVCE